MAGLFCAGPKPARPRPLTTPSSKSGHLARALRRTDSRPRIALLQSLVGINQSHGRMTTGVRSNHLSRCPASHATLGRRTQLFSHAAQCDHGALASKRLVAGLACRLHATGGWCRIRERRTFTTSGNARDSSWQV